MIYQGYTIVIEGKKCIILRNNWTVITFDDCDWDQAKKWIDEHKAHLANERDRLKAKGRSRASRH